MQFCCILNTKDYLYSGYQITLLSSPHNPFVMKKAIIAILGVAMLAACDKKPSRVNIMDVKLEPPADASADLRIDEPVGNSQVNAVRFPPPVVVADKEAKDVSKKIIKQGDIHFETDNVAGTKKAIYAQLTKLNGYASGENETNDNESNRKEFTINAKVPAKNFDLFLINVSANAVKIDSKNISMRDVTTEYIDMTTRLSNKKKLEERYLELLKKGDKISDLLQIENKLTEIRSEIESTQGQLNYLLKQVDYSSLDITFYAKQNVKESGETFSYKIKSALGSGWDSLSAWFYWFIGAWPLWLIITAVIVIFKRWRKRRKTNR
ncbi:MAG: hypothetical protein JWR50_3756 [Mucilaginibacter sp.]|nr:hypothetical protein [Mucilaginibacter sp.]